MEVTEATDTDIPAIVELLKISLGETLMPKSERYWRWKHVENPFGPSPVFLCWEGSTLIGVRAFMRWEWVRNGKIYRTVRAVDTATHPDHQGKGIFRKLTLALVDQCKEAGDQFVFNTPNEKSRPGYLKMGWMEAGKLPVHFTVRRPVGVLTSLLGKKIPSFENESSDILAILGSTDVPALLHEHHQRIKQFLTNTTPEYLKWRYADVPVVKYFALADSQDKHIKEFLVGRVKITKAGRELRIVDHYSRTGKLGSVLSDQLRELRRAMKIDYETFSGVIGVKVPMSLGLTLNLGPIVTVRSLVMKDLECLSNFKDWSPSLGDLELF